MTLDHPLIGQLTPSREKLAITRTAGQILVIHHPETGIPDADKLALLASAALPARELDARASSTPRS